MTEIVRQIQKLKEEKDVLILAHYYVAVSYTHLGFSLKTSSKKSRNSWKRGRIKSMRIWN